MDEIKFNSTLKKDEKIREHDMTFIEYIKMKSKDKLTIDGEVGIKTRELAERVGINYEMFRKILNKTKPNQPRDCIIAICAALFLSEYETNDALFYYDYLPRLDDTPGCREYYIIQTLQGNRERKDDFKFLHQSVAEVNKTLRYYGFSELRLSNKIKSKESKIVVQSDEKVDKYSITTEIRTNRFSFQDSLCDRYHPNQYRVGTQMTIKYPENMRCQLEYDSRNNFLIKYEQDGEWFRNIPEIVNKDSELFLRYFNIIKDMNLRELRSCYETAFDTRNHGLRQSAKYSKGKIELYSEKYNYIQPERNEYFYGEIMDGTFTFTIQKESRFMERYLSVDDFKKYYPYKMIEESCHRSFTSLKEIKDYCIREQWDSDIEWCYVQEFKSMKNHLDGLKNSLIDKKQFIRSYDDYFSGEDQWRIYEYYNVLHEFGVLKTEKQEEYKGYDPFAEKNGLDDGLPIGTFLGYHERTWFEPTKNEATVKYKNKTVNIDDSELKLAFELGIDNLEEICSLKLKHPNLRDLSIKDFI
ncbi:hypothetical protein [Streptococcus salivarius]